MTLRPRTGNARQILRPAFMRLVARRSCSDSHLARASSHSAQRSSTHTSRPTQNPGDCAEQSREAQWRRGLTCQSSEGHRNCTVGLRRPACHQQIESSTRYLMNAPLRLKLPSCSTEAMGCEDATSRGRRFRIGQPVVYRVQKRSPRPCRHAINLRPDRSGEYYSYEVEKYWIVDGDDRESDSWNSTWKEACHRGERQSAATCHRLGTYSLSSPFSQGIPFIRFRAFETVS